MRTWHLMATTLLATGLASPVFAEDAADSAAPTEAKSLAAPASAAPAQKAFSTGVAKGRDLLDTAISASVIDETDLAKLSVSSVAGIVQNIPGIRALTPDLDGFSSITVRGLPLAADGSKFLQLQEDGLPVLEFGDMQFNAGDRYLRADRSISQIQSIRGGSASTFASNSPGGVVNLISKTGETQGGAIQLSSGLGHDLKRLDFDYGGSLGKDWRFHFAGFYREGEGPRNVGYTGFKGGQLKFNITRSFSGGYIRLYGKFLDDRQPNYGTVPVSMTGTDDKPRFAALPGTSLPDDSALSPLLAAYPGTDAANRRTSRDLTDGMRAEVKAIGLETQFEAAGWTVSNRFRYSDIKGEYNQLEAMLTAPAGVVATILGGPGATLRYAGGSQAVVTPGSAINGNGLARINLLINIDQDSLDYWVNDLRASRVFDVGSAKLTLSLGLYNSSQDIANDWNFTNRLSDHAANGGSAPLDLVASNGSVLTQNGILSYGFGFGQRPAFGNYRQDVNYRIKAPYGSVNLATGKLSIGASVRYDKGNVSGRNFNQEVIGTVDVDGDGTISPIETRVPVLPLTTPINVKYDFGYLSFSTGVNYRVAESLAVFARYSRGGRASADRVLRPESLNAVTGQLNSENLEYGTVKQAEAGVKYRQGKFAVYLTGFWAGTEERNTQLTPNSAGLIVPVDIVRRYSAKGAELEADIAAGPFSMALGATWTKASIKADSASAAIVGNVPRYIPNLAFQARPSFNFGPVSVGAVVNGTTSSFAQDTNLLRIPGYVLVSPFLQVQATDRLTVDVKAFNVFDKTAIFTVSNHTLPTSGIGNVQVMNGRTVSTSIRYSF